MAREWIGKVIKNETRGGGYFTLTLGLPIQFSKIKPGNFVMLSAGEEPTILLRRPMAFYDVNKTKSGTHVSFLYSVVGRGTNALVKVRTGSELSFLGPLGNSFSKPKKNERVAVLAGGIGIAPFLRWGKDLTSDQKKNASFYFGFRNQNQTKFLQDFKKEKIKPIISTDEPGSAFHGNVVDCFKKNMGKEKPDRILTCGPEKMMTAVIKMAQELRVPCEASLEARMGCGVGVCLSCVCEYGERARGGYSLVCQDGPVFILQPNA